MRPTACLALLVFAALAPQAMAAQRTFVSTSGADANTASNCSLSFPCRSFGSALTVTDAKGEIVVLASGGYGSVTVDKSVSIVSPAGVFAGISVFPATDGVVVDGAGVIVTLKGLTINGQGGQAGIRFLQGARLNVEECEIANVGVGNTGGILDQAPGSVLIVRNTIIHDTANMGIWVKEVTGAAKATLVAENVALHDLNGWGIYIGGPGHLGTAEGYLTHVTVTGAVATGVVADSLAGGATLVSIVESTISGNGYGVNSTGDGARAVVAGSTLVRNVAYALTTGGATSTLLSRGDNIVHDNNNGGVQTGGIIGSLSPL